MRLTRWCSFSRSFKRLASEAFMPPYWARQRWNVCSEISGCLATVAMSAPSAWSRSASRSFLMICSGGVPGSFHTVDPPRIPRSGQEESRTRWHRWRGSGQMASAAGCHGQAAQSSRRTENL
jgi:hypothetical protein